MLQTITDAMIDIARDDEPGSMFARIVAHAREVVPHCDYVAATVVGTRGRLDCPAATGEVAASCDRLQHALHEGPALAAVEDGTPVRVQDLLIEHRWPEFALRAAGRGVRSVLAVPLAAGHGTLGAVDLYAEGLDAFDVADEQTSAAFAAQVGIVLAGAQLSANLRTAMQSREVIGRAVGILMERHRVTAALAFDMLALASQHSHRKLRDIAAWMTETGEDPGSLILPD